MHVMTTTAARPVDDYPLDRLRQASVDVRDAKQAYDDRLKLRDRLVEDAVDAGVPQRTIAAAAGISRGLITQILARP